MSITALLRHFERRAPRACRGLSAIQLTLTAMELTILATYLLLMAEITFAACFLGNEVMRYVLRCRITRFEQFTHSIPERRYLSHFCAPLITILASAGAGAGAGMVASIHEGWFVPYLGIIVLLATMISFGRYLLNDAAGITPRPVSRARLRRLLADVSRRLDADTPMPSPAEFVTIRVTLIRIRRVGDRLAGQSLSWRWRDAIRRERRLLIAAVMLATLLPVVVGSLATVRLIHGDHRALPVFGTALILIAANLAGVLLRGRRCRDEQYDLGVELRSESTKLLARLETIPEPGSTAPRATRILFTIGVFMHRWLRTGQPSFPGTRLSGASE